MIYVFTDGGCLNNGTQTAEAVWAVVLTRDINQTDNYFQMSGYVPGSQQTNNRGELTAILQALQHIKNYYSEDEVTICSDSMYCINCITVWGEQWIAKGIEKKNMDLIRKILKIKCNNIIFKHVRGHSERSERADGFSIYNRIVDKCCTELLKNKKK